MKRIERWLRSGTGLAVVGSLLVAVTLLTVAGFQLGWWSLAASSLGGTAGGGTGLDVTLKSFTAKVDRGRPVLRWEIQSERNLKGFHVYRAESGTNAFVQVNSNLITKPQYDFRDMTAEAGFTYDYYLLAVGLQGGQVQLKTVTVEIP
ncbi:MAG: hypothetical protein JW850_20145 [Thermoflexales bacterium]|nr:hypothetical protein [Thermoflexales bacterium]